MVKLKAGTYDSILCMWKGREGAKCQQRNWMTEVQMAQPGCEAAWYKIRHTSFGKKKYGGTGDIDLFSFF